MRRTPLTIAHEKSAGMADSGITAGAGQSPGFFRIKLTFAFGSFFQMDWACCLPTGFFPISFSGISQRIFLQ
jgi:hypothetical protein